MHEEPDARGGDGEVPSDHDRVLARAHVKNRVREAHGEPRLRLFAGAHRSGAPQERRQAREEAAAEEPLRALGKDDERERVPRIPPARARPSTHEQER